MEIDKKITPSANKPLGFLEDSFVFNEIIELISKHGVKTFIETGTNEAKSTISIAPFVEKVFSIEIDEGFFNKSKEATKEIKNITIHHGSSEKILDKILPEINDKILFFLDAHWNHYCPILDELELIAKHGKQNSIIVIHDFKVPNTTLGYMRLPTSVSIQGDVPLSISFIQDKLHAIYPNGFYYYYNLKSDSWCPTGVIFIIPQ